MPGWIRLRRLSFGFQDQHGWPSSNLVRNWDLQAHRLSDPDIGL